MELTQAEKLILHMLAQLHERLEINDGTAKIVNAAIETDNLWALDFELTYIIGEDKNPAPAQVTFVGKTLTLWERLEKAFARFDEAGKSTVAEALGYESDVQFEGFDGNNEGRYNNIARMLVNVMGRHPHFRDRQFDSHITSAPGYRAMIQKDEELDKGWDLSPQDVASILLARRGRI